MGGGMVGEWKGEVGVEQGSLRDGIWKGSVRIATQRPRPGPSKDRSLQLHSLSLYTCLTGSNLAPPTVQSGRPTAARSVRNRAAGRSKKGLTFQIAKNRAAGTFYEKEDTFCASELAGIESTPPHSGRARYTPALTN